MGHERVGILPKTRKWREILKEISAIGEADVDIAGIVKQTTDNVRHRLAEIERDASLLAAFKFLVVLTVASRASSPVAALNNLGVEATAPTPIMLAKALQEWMPARAQSLEYSRMAQSAAMDAIAAWTSEHSKPEENLF